MSELRIALANDESIDHGSGRSSNKRPKNRQRGFFTPVSNSVLLTRCLTTKARQILLILELRAGASRIAKLSCEEIARLTGYTPRTVERSLSCLRTHEWVSRNEAGTIHLCQPLPTNNYVQVYEGVVHHPVWEDWQKHILLFVMSQFRGRDREFGIRRYSLNLYGRKQPSVEQSCRIPGSTKQRRRMLRDFVEQLQDKKILFITEDATSNRPAFCRIDRDALEQLLPEYDRHAAATVRVTTSDGSTLRHASRSNTVARHLAVRHASLSTTVTRNVAAPSSVTYEKDLEDSEHSNKIPESPRFACGERGAISSRSQSTSPDDDNKSGYDRSESGVGGLAIEDSFVSLMESPQYRELTEEVDGRCSGFVLHKSRTGAATLAERWTLLLEQLPCDVSADDIELAIKSREFEGLNSKSWGLLLNERYITRFCVEIKKRYDDRQRMTLDAEARFEALVSSLGSRDSATRITAIERLASFGGSKPDVALRIALLLSSRQRDGESKVRFAAVQRLAYLAAMKFIPDRCRESIRRIAQRTLKDEDEEVREEAGFLLEELDRLRTVS